MRPDLLSATDWRRVPVGYTETIGEDIYYVDCYGLVRSQSRAVPLEPCEVCGRVTTRRKRVIDPKSLRRLERRLCPLHEKGSSDAARARTLNDWKRHLPDQWPGIARTAIRQFIKSGATEAVAPRPLNYTIVSLGLAKDVYSEQRSGRVWFRRLVGGHPPTPSWLRTLLNRLRHNSR